VRKAPRYSGLCRGLRQVRSTQELAFAHTMTGGQGRMCLQKIAAVRTGMHPGSRLQAPMSAIRQPPDPSIPCESLLFCFLRLHPAASHPAAKIG